MRKIVSWNAKGRVGLALKEDWRIAALLLLALLAAMAGKSQSPDKTPVGRWQVVNDATGRNNGVVEIADNNGELRGHLVAGADPVQFETRLCDKCPGDRYGQPFKGLLILSGLRRNGDEWDGGEILDPETGKVYRAKLKLDGNGKKLLIRGYVGFSLLGRTQTWTRIE